MALNPPLLWVSAFFFQVLACLLYLLFWGAASLLLRLAGRAFRPAARKRLLMACLLLPPLLALALTAGGATLHHVHGAVGRHHSDLCGRLFGGLYGLGAGQGVPHGAVGALASGGAWLLTGAGLTLVLRLARATRQIELGLVPFLSTPSPELRASLARVGTRMAGVRTERFFECPIPAACSSVLGLLEARCVLSRDLVASSSPEELDAVVAHEAGHLRAGDVPATFLVGSLNCLFFFVRPVRLLGRAWREAAELACDDEAVRATGQPQAMAAAILRASGVPAAPQAGSRLPAVALAFADDAACSPAVRVERLLDQARRASLPPAEARLHAALGWLGTIAVAGAGFAALRSPEAECFAHCALEAVAHLFR